MTPDGKFTQTETWSINGYAAASASGTYTDGNYTFPNNIVFRQTPNSASPEVITTVFDYNGNILLGSNNNWSVTSANTAVKGALFTGNTFPTNAGLINSVYAPSSQQGITIQNVGGDTGSGHAILFSRTDGTTEGSVVISASGTAFNTTSDIRLKNNIMSTNELEVNSIFDKLQVVDYMYNGDSKKITGFIAQDEYKVLPNCVTPGDYDTMPGEEGFNAWQRSDACIAPYLVKEVQSLRKRVQYLE